MKPKSPDPVCVVVHPSNPSILEAETDQRISVRSVPAWSMGKPRLQSEFPSQTKQHQRSSYRVLTLERTQWNEVAIAED